MTNEFNAWLQQNNLVELFTTVAGDSFYYNKELGFGAVKNQNPFNVQTFYLNDVKGFETKDDEIRVAAWTQGGVWSTFPKGTRHSSNELYIYFTFGNQPRIKLQIFKAQNRNNISRSSTEHWRMYNYACQLSQLLFQCFTTPMENTPVIEGETNV